MPKSVHPLDSIDIKSPCASDWDSMVGNDVVRFCQHCNLNVHDLSLMTRQEALALVRNSNGRLCLRYIRRPDGTIQTAPPFQKLHLIKRRATKIVAGAFGATLSICASVAAQTPSTAGETEIVCEVPRKANPASMNLEGGVAQLAGTIVDASKAVIAGATVTLINESTQNEMSAESNEEGKYRFPSLAGGSYTLVVDSPGFMRNKIEHVNVPGVGEQRLDVSLEVAALGGAMVVIAPSEPLVQAVLEDDAALVRELLAGGANVNVVDKAYQTTPLVEAVARGNPEIVSILLQAGANVDGESRKSQRAIMRLSERSTGEIVRALVYAGAKINDRDEDGNTPLLNAAAMDNAELVRAVIAAGANLDEQNEAGQTALMLAAREGYIANVQALLDARASGYLQDEDGWTALKYAQDNSHYDVAELLKVYGVTE
ncbi:MAG TPA: ankyrin repeat domain-containing protein [Pyrinomonadaceae bacterium]|jgi:hypothetical protein